MKLPMEAEESLNLENNIISLQQGANDREILRNRHEIHVHYVDLESFKKTFCLKGYLPADRS